MKTNIKYLQNLSEEFVKASLKSMASVDLNTDISFSLTDEEYLALAVEAKERGGKPEILARMMVKAYCKDKLKNVSSNPNLLVSLINYTVKTMENPDEDPEGRTSGAKKFGPDKVYISAVYNELVDNVNLSMSLDQFKKFIVNNRDRIPLSRADLVEAMPSDLVDESKTEFEDDYFGRQDGFGGDHYNFIRTDGEIL